MNWGADLRVRNEYFNDLLTLNPNANLHEQDYFRFRGRLWTSITPLDDLSLNARLADEPREWMKPAGYTPFKGQSRPGLEGGHHRQPQCGLEECGGLAPDHQGRPPGPVPG